MNHVEGDIIVVTGDGVADVGGGDAEHGARQADPEGDFVVELSSRV